MSQMRRLLTLLSLLVLATSCGSDSTTSTTNSLSGTYSLKTVNGAPLPFILAQQGTTKTELASDAFTFNSDGTFSRTSTARTTTNGTVTTETTPATGTWARLGSMFTFLESTAGSSRISGTITATGFTIGDVGILAVYSK